MDECEVSGDKHKEKSIGTAGAGLHMQQDKPCEQACDWNPRGDDCSPVTEVEKVPIAKPEAVSGMKAVENAIGDIKEPCPEEENQERAGGQRDLQGAGDAPRPDGGDTRSVKREQVPVLSRDQDWKPAWCRGSNKLG